MKKNFLFLIIMASIILIGCNNRVFDGSRTSNDNQFLLSYNILNDTKTHNIELQEGDRITVVIENVSGSLDIAVSDIDGKEIYRGNHASSEKFNFTIPKSNTYIFLVTGKKAKGSVGFLVTE